MVEQLIYGNPVDAYMRGLGQAIQAKTAVAQEARAAELHDLAKKAQQQSYDFNAQMQPYQIQQAGQQVQLGATQVDQATRRQQWQEGFSALGANPTFDQISEFNSKFPEFTSATSQAFSAMSEGHRAAAGQMLGQGVAALRAGDTATAKKVIEQYADAAEASGDMGAAQAARSSLGMIDSNPEGAANYMASILATVNPEGARSILGVSASGVQRTDPVGDGTVAIQYMRDGSTRVVDNATGEVLQGQAANDAIARAQEAEQAQRGGIKAAETGSALDVRIEKGGEAQRVEARGSAVGKAEGERAASAQAAVQKASDSIALIDSILAAPDLEGITGQVDAMRPVWMNSQGGRDLIVKIDQLKGQAFLQAFESLKGGGQITEIEGKKATEAMARLDRAQSTEAYREALTELRGIIERGMERARNDAGAAGVKLSTTGALGRFIGKQ